MRPLKKMKSSASSALRARGKVPLRCLNRLEEITDGEILIDGVHLSKENENEVRTEMGMVFQSFNLFPHMSVLDNVTIGPRKVRRIDRKEAEKRRWSFWAG